MAFLAVVLILVVAGPILWQIPRALWPIRLNSDATRFRGLYRRYNVETFTGYASDVRQWTDTKTYGSTVTGTTVGTVGANGFVTGTTTYRDNRRHSSISHTGFFLTDEAGRTGRFDAANVTPSIGEGHLVSAAWIVRNGKAGPAFLVYNHTTGMFYIETHRGRGTGRPKRGLVNMVVTLPLIHSALFVLALPVYVLVGFGIRAQLNLFRKFGVRPLAAKVQRRAAEMPPAPVVTPEAARDLAAQVKEITALHQSGALTAEEFTAAKARLLDS